MPSTTRYRWGDVVLVAFPLSDMSGAIRRPGLVLFDSGDEDVMLARITTQAGRDRTDVRLVDCKAAGLIAASIVRLSKIATIRKSLIDRHLGRLSSKDKKTVQIVWSRIFAGPRRVLQAHRRLQLIGAAGRVSDPSRRQVRDAKT